MRTSLQRIRRSDSLRNLDVIPTAAGHASRVKKRWYAAWFADQTNPLCKRCFKLADRKRFAGDMLNCSICKTYCHKGRGTVPESERNFRYGHANFKCPTCAEITPKVTPPRRRSSARGKGIKTEVMRGPANDDVWARLDQKDDDEHATASSHSGGGHP